MSERAQLLARDIATLAHALARRHARSLARDRTLQRLIVDLVAARTAVGLTQEDVAARMWTTKASCRASKAAGERGRRCERSRTTRARSVRASRSACGRRDNPP
jgi:hypothetical protein